MQWIFDEYRLDAENATLWRDDQPLALRPKTFDVLHYLVQHAGELVRKETLMEEVWADAYVVEGVLTTSMSELRKLLGDSGKAPRFIATAYRRGYRFIAPVESVVENGGGRVAAISSTERCNDRDDGSSRAQMSTSPVSRGFIGREDERSHIAELLLADQSCRILSLIGTGGIGKTRLALAVVETIKNHADNTFSDGIYFISLQSLGSEDSVCGAIANALNVVPDGEQLNQQLFAYLRDKNMLLVLDNFEHVLSSASDLQSIVSCAHNVKILVTSREALGISSAWFHPVSGLEFNQPDSESFRLFVALARRSEPTFDESQHRRAIARVCQLVEGMPLAIELATSWLNVLSVDEIADEIASSTDILSTQHGDVSSRHASIHAVMVETWELLTDSEQLLLARLSVFRGGCTRHAIVEVADAGLILIVQLVNKALLRSTREKRYKMHELVRQFSGKKLAASSELAIEARNKHAHYYMQFLTQKSGQLSGSKQGETCQLIHAELDNVRAAWAWCIEQRQWKALLEASPALFLFCELRGHFEDGRTLFEDAAESAQRNHANREVVDLLFLRVAIFKLRLSQYQAALNILSDLLETNTDAKERALILRFLGDYHFAHGGFIKADQALRYLQESIELCGRQLNVSLEVECLCEMAILSTNLTLDISRSRQCAARAVELAREQRRPDLLTNALDVLAWTTNHSGDYAAAEKLWMEVRTIAERNENRAGQATAVNWLGWSAWSVGAGRLEEAVAHYQDALQRYESLGSRANIAMTCADLAVALLELDRLEESRSVCKRGLSIATEIGREDHYVYNLYCLGAVECAAGNLRDARKQLRKALALAWQQEEQTNKPVVIYFVAKLLFAENISNTSNTDANKFENILTLLLFLQYNPATWQAFRDRAAKFQQELESRLSTEAVSHALMRTPEDIISEVSERIPMLLSASVLSAAQ